MSSDPYPLRGGHNYHLAEAGRLTDVTGRIKGWVATCDACGWAGPERSTKDAAEDDCLAHDTTHNPA